MISFAERGKASVIIDGQFGSTGKGLIAAYLAGHNSFDVATTNASANAGHTTIIRGYKFVTYHLPTIGVMQPHCRIYLNAGAIIDPDVLFEEMERLDVHPSRITIHPRAAIINDLHRQQEKGALSSTTGLASTQKGVGAALADKVMRRRGSTAGELKSLSHLVGELPLNDILVCGQSVAVEVPQGFSLGINSGLAYPYCTGRDVTVAQALADAGIHPRFLGKTMMTTRTKPIRVGNIYDDAGNQIGWSGPCYPDQQETSFEELGLEPEYTTVTKRKRRIFSWSDEQYRQACRAIRPDFVFMNFVNYLNGWDEFKDLLERTSRTGFPATHFGIGPSVEEVIEGWSEVPDRMGWIE